MMECSPFCTYGHADPREVCGPCGVPVLRDEPEIKKPKRGEFRIVPCDLDEANWFVERHHRHHGPVRGHKFSIALMQDRGEGRVEYFARLACCGVAIVGRPVARMLDNGLTLEVYRVATDGTKDACSALYGACRRATFALGYKKLITYTLIEESGTSLKAAGWKCLGEAGGGSWSVPSRPRIDKHPTQKKLRWETQVETSEVSGS